MALMTARWARNGAAGAQVLHSPRRRAGGGAAILCATLLASLLLAAGLPAGASALNTYAVTPISPHQPAAACMR